MRNAVRLFLVGALLATGLITPAKSSEAVGTIILLHARASDNLHWVQLDVAPVGRPPCASAHSYYMIRDENGAAGKSQFAQLLAAQMAGRKVKITGSGACTRWGDGEDIEIIDVVVTP